jgi:hypothetical protein
MHALLEAFNYGSVDAENRPEVTWVLSAHDSDVVRPGAERTPAMRNDERTESDAPGGDRVEADSPYLPLARWLQQLMATGVLTAPDHEELFQQLPDFIAFLLAHGPLELPEQFGPLVYHLIGCQTCRGSYLELYSAMQEALLEEDTEALAE